MSSSTPSFFWKHVRPTGAVVPPQTCCHSLVAYQNRYLITFGGASLDYSSQEVYVYDVDENVWEHKKTAHADLAQARMVHSAAIYKNKMILYGGFSQSPASILDDVLALDLDTWVWGLLGSASETVGPGAREFHTAHVVKDRMYVIMGLKEEMHRSLIWYLDLLTGAWHEVLVAADQVNVAPSHSLGGHASAVEGDTVFIFGGTNARNMDSPTVFYSNELYAFSFSTHRWRRFVTPTAPPPRYGAVMGVWNGVVHLFGGDQSASRLFFGDFWRIDTKAESLVWEEIGLGDDAPRSSHPPSRTGKGWMVPRSWSNLERPSPRSAPGYATLRGALFVLGGEGFEIPIAPPPDYPHPVGFPAVLFNLPLTQVVYSNDLYMYPMGWDREMPLMASAARWMSSVWVRHGKQVTEEMALWEREESAGVVRALKQCLPSALPWGGKSTSTPSP